MFQLRKSPEGSAGLVDDQQVRFGWGGGSLYSDSEPKLELHCRAPRGVIHVLIVISLGTESGPEIRLHGHRQVQDGTTHLKSVGQHSSNSKSAKQLQPLDQMPWKVPRLMQNVDADTKCVTIFFFCLVWDHSIMETKFKTRQRTTVRNSDLA